MLLGAILGLAGSFLPELLKFVKEERERKYEIEMFKLELEKAEILNRIELEKAKTLAQIELDKAIYDFAKPEITPTGFRLADTLQAIAFFANTMIRPIITVFAFFLLLFPDVLSHIKQYPYLADIYPDLLSGIVFFWFGNRSMQKAMRGNI